MPAFLRSTVALLLLAFGLIPLAQVHAQNPDLLPPHSHIRYWRAEFTESSEADVIAHRGDTLWIRSRESGDSLVLPLTALRRLQVQTGLDDHGAFGAGVGVFLGAIVGSFQFQHGGHSSDAYQRDVAKAYLFALVSGAVGWLVGSLFHSRRWEDVPLTAEMGSLTATAFDASDLALVTG